MYVKSITEYNYNNSYKKHLNFQNVNFKGLYLQNQVSNFCVKQAHRDSISVKIKNLLYKKNGNNLEAFKQYLKKQKEYFVSSNKHFQDGYKNLLELGEKNPKQIPRVIKLLKSGFLLIGRDGCYLSKDNSELLDSQLTLYEKVSERYNWKHYTSILFKPNNDNEELTKEDVEAKIRMFDKFNPKKNLTDRINFILSKRLFSESINQIDIDHAQLSIISKVNSINERVISKLVNSKKSLINSSRRKEISTLDIEDVANKITKDNVKIVESILLDYLLPPRTLPLFINKISTQNQHIFEKIIKQNFSLGQIQDIVKNLSDKNIKFLLKLINTNNDSLNNNDKSNIFLSYNECSADSLNYIINRINKNNAFQDKGIDIANFGNSIKKTNQNYAEEWIRLPKISINTLVDILKNANEINISLADEFLKDKHFNKDTIPNIMENCKTEDTRTFIQKLHSNAKMSGEDLTEIAELLNDIDSAILEGEEGWDLRIVLNDALGLKENYGKIINKCGLSLDKKINELAFLLQIKYKPSVFKCKNSNFNEFLTKILSNNNSLTDKVLKTANYDKYKTGIPLQYSREQFYENITEKLLKNVKAEDKTKILQYFGFNNGETTFDGLFQDRNPNILKKLLFSEKGKCAADAIYSEINKFVYKNEVITDDKDLNTLLNALIKGIPAYSSIIGKKQHGTHAYTVDIHSLKVLQSGMNNPLYEKLSDESKIILKLSAILHDIGKREGIIDKGHAKKSADFSESILDSLPLKKDVKTRVVNIIKYHHWFEEYNKCLKTSDDIAIICRHPEDFEIFKILAKADLENVNKNFHFDVTCTKNQKEFDKFFDKKTSNIKKSLDSIYNSASLLYNTRILNNGINFPVRKFEIDGKILNIKVLDLNQFKDNDDISIYGFPKGTQKKDVRLFVHMMESNFEKTKELLDAYSNDNCWSATLVKPDNNLTYWNRKFGFILDVNQSDISEASQKNIGSGYKKNFKDFKQSMFSKSDNTIRDSFVRDLKKHNIKLNDNEYAELVKYLMKKKYITAIRKDFYIGDKLIKASDIVKSLKKSEKKIFARCEHNEIVLINPKLQGIFLKFQSVDIYPKSLLKFAYKYDLPIIVMKPEA